MKQKLVLGKIGLFILLICWGIAGFAQNRTISGVVLEFNNGTIPGVTIAAKGTTKGTISDMNGKYSLVIDQEVKTLVFSFVGMKSEEVLIGSSATINVTLKPDVLSVDEVVVVGYGTQKKSDITGSVASVKSEQLERIPQTNITQALQGNVSGLSVTTDAANAEGNSNSILIRGQNSISASTTPLIILDGIPYSGNMSDISPNDVASIEILKDASSAAIYGSRASNGVILLTTKKGKEGKIKVNYDGYYGIQNIAHLPEMMDASTFYNLKVERYGIGYLSASETEGFQAGRNTDWVKLATRAGSQTQQNISISGGTEKSKYYISGSFLNSKGVAINDDYSRYNLRINFDQQLTSWLKFGTNTILGYYDRSGRPASFTEAFLMNRLAVPYEADGSLTIFPWKEDNYFGNPMEGIKFKNKDISHQIVTNNFFLVDLPFVKGLSYKINTGYTFRNRLFEEYQGRDTKSGYQKGGVSDVNNTYSSDWIIENLINYDNSFGKHHLFLTALYSAQSQRDEAHNMHGENFPNDVMTYYQPNKAKLYQPVASYNQKNYISQMGRLNYAYDSRYLFTLTVRRDGYSGFGANTKFGIFPSVAIAWNAANEKFVQSIGWISGLKLRMSYGENGNQAVGAYSTLPRLTGLDYMDGKNVSMFGFYPSKLGDENLGWETTKSINAGIDFAFFKNRISGNIEYYNSNTFDLLLTRSISAVNGTTSITQNVGETKNQGIEFQVSSVNINNHKIKWTTDFNISSNRNKIVNVGLVDVNGNYMDDVASQWFIGKPINVNYAYLFDGIWQTGDNNAASAQPTAVPGDVRVLDANGDLKITPDDRRIIGSLYPDYIAGMTNTIEYKNFSLSFFVQTVQGITKQNTLITTDDYQMRQNQFKLTYWTAANPINTFPRNAQSQLNNQFAVRWYEDASFIRLKDVTFGYKIPENLIKGAGINRLEIYCNAKNLYTRTKWNGLDPELSDQRSSPLMRTILFGIKLGF